MAGPQHLPARETSCVGHGRDVSPDVATGSAPRTPSRSLRRTRVAFYGRSARVDGAHQAIAGQLRAVRTVLPPDAVLVACFADVGAWDGWPANARAETNDCTGWVLGEHTVAGGIITLLRRFAHPTPDPAAPDSRAPEPAVPDSDLPIFDSPEVDAPDFDVVACSDPYRLSRRTAQRWRIEDGLAANGVAVFTAQGPPWSTPAPPVDREGKTTWLLRN
jgi:hypothetical protein